LFGEVGELQKREERSPEKLEIALRVTTGCQQIGRDQQHPTSDTRDLRELLQWPKGPGTSLQIISLRAERNQGEAENCYGSLRQVD